MNRRDLLQSLFIAPLATSSATPHSIPGHYYAWRDGPFTTDASCAPLQYGDASPRIFLNGKELPLETPVTRCVSGENGFVECFDEAEFKRALAIDPFVVFNADGTKNPHPLDELPVITLRGRVEVVPR